MTTNEEFKKREKKLRSTRYKQNRKRRVVLPRAEWLKLRYQAFKEYGNQCKCCGAGPKQAVLHVDHIKPKSLYPELALTLSNLQILCEACNLGKSNRDTTDWR